MGKIADQIKQIQIDEKLTLPELFSKYPHLATLQHKELLEESEQEKLPSAKKQLKLLLD